MKAVCQITACLVCAGLLLAACEQPEFTPKGPETYRPGTPGSNMMMRAPITVADGLEVILSDVIIPPGATVPLHYHPGEEFIYVLEGTAIHREEGKEDREVKAGETLVIPPEAVHSPMGGPDGARAIVFRVHTEGRDERYPVATGEEAPKE